MQNLSEKWLTKSTSMDFALKNKVLRDILETLTNLHQEKANLLKFLLSHKALWGQ